MNIPKLQSTSKKKILLLSDDLRLHSGIGTMSKEFVMGTMHKYDWVQIGGAVKHPEENKVIDMCQAAADHTGVQDAYLKLYATSGYGNQNILRQVMQIEKPDAIMHFTDPRFWGWLYEMEHEVRQHIPLLYYNIWDDLPFPHWNENFYETCDLLMAISKQTYNINKHVCQRKPRVEGVDLTYVPHGIDTKLYYPVDTNNGDYKSFKSKLLNGKEYDFIALFNSRNIHRKRPGDLMLAFKKFCDTLPDTDKGKCALIMHTDVVDQAGTDLLATKNALCPDYDVIFSNQKLPPNQLNYIYNIADVTCNPSSAEGFGLSHMESLMAGTPTIATVVGGLQDQMGFVTEDGEPLNVKHLTKDIPSNSTGEISRDWGKWVYPLWPQMNLQGSPMTPYIYDSRPNVKDITEGFKWWYNMSREHREKCGLEGRQWAIENGFSSEGMCDAMIESIEGCFNTWRPRKKFILINTDREEAIYPDGVLI
jgi:glycosyltransferase involved in cell wall biosynthesis